MKCSTVSNDLYVHICIFVCKYSIYCFSHLKIVSRNIIAISGDSVLILQGELSIAFGNDESVFSTLSARESLSLSCGTTNVQQKNRAP